MKTLNFSVEIDAPKEIVWDVLWNDETYPKWTAVFSEGSKATSDWKEGSTILFTDESGGGMYSRIKTKVPNQQMTFEHLGVLKDGVEVPMDDETKSWSGSIEEFLLNESNGVTHLKVSVDVTEDFWDYFQKTFPKALEKVKELSEQL